MPTGPNARALAAAGAAEPAVKAGPEQVGAAGGPAAAALGEEGLAGPSPVFG